jgi:hypothetical protein
MSIAQQLGRLLPSEGRRRLALSTAIYCAVTLVFWLFASSEVRHEHTAYNHYALLAEAWLDGRFSLAGSPPLYTGGNDFALYDGNWYVVFPPFPAVLLLPAVWFADGEPSAIADGRYFLFLAGVAPAVLFLVLQKLRDMGRSIHSEREALLLSALFAFGSVYFFSAVQGSVWYAAHIVGAGLIALYALWSLGAERPLAAGIVLGFAFLTRAPLVLAVPLFVFEAWRVCRLPNKQAKVAASEMDSGAPREALLSVSERLHTFHSAVDWRSFAARCGWFFAPLSMVMLAALFHNYLRFDACWDFGYRHLEIRWQGRIAEWGLFHYHYLARNLGVMLTGLPWIGNTTTGAAFQINAHGLALWLTTPLYLWLLWPRQRSCLTVVLWFTTLCVALPTLFYQNTGWVQFGHRFSNDYAVFLFMLFALGGHRLGRLFYTLALLSVLVNAFGALSFNRAEYRAFYHIDRSQRVIYQPD